MSAPIPFQISALPLDAFAPLFDLDDGALAARGMRRLVADSKPGFPCRVSLVDAEVGERVLLLPYTHHAVHGPYRASGPVFAREAARPAELAVNEVPDSVRGRLLSIRGYDKDGTLVGADVKEGRALEEVIWRLFGDERVRYIHLHNARPGCYSCRVDRA
jgi:uncharacterized protein DUF1203